jgi:hypothetical protein
MSDAEHEFALRLDARVDEFGERLAKIEGGMNAKPARSFWQWLSGLGALVAFILSLASSVYTVHNNYVVEPRREREQQAANLKKEQLQQEVNLRNDATGLAELVARIAGLDWTNNQQAANAQAGLLAPQRYALRDRILAADAAMPHVLSFSERLLLSNELEFVARWQQALAYNTLLHAAATVPAEQAYASWARARILLALNQVDGMRNAYALAIEQFKAAGLETHAGSVLQVYLQWITREFNSTTCDTAAAVHARLVADYNRPEVWPATRQFFFPQYQAMLDARQGTCGLSLEQPVPAAG